MSGGANNGQQNGMNSTTAGGANTPGAQTPQWLKGLQAGQQIMQLGQQRPMQPQMPMQRPGGGAPQGMPQQGVVPGAQGASPMMPSQAPGMATAGQGMPQGMTPQMMQQLMMMRGGGGGGLMQ